MWLNIFNKCGFKILKAPFGLVLLVFHGPGLRFTYLHLFALHYGSTFVHLCHVSVVCAFEKFSSLASPSSFALTPRVCSTCLWGSSLLCFSSKLHPCATFLPTASTFLGGPRSQSLMHLLCHVSSPLGFWLQGKDEWMWSPVVVPRVLTNFMGGWHMSSRDLCFFHFWTTFINARGRILFKVTKYHVSKYFCCNGLWESLWWQHGPGLGNLFGYWISSGGEIYLYCFDSL